jgi:hypothetical protein
MQVAEKLEVIRPPARWSSAVVRCKCGKGVTLTYPYVVCKCGVEIVRDSWRGDIGIATPAVFRRAIAEALDGHLSSYEERDDHISLTYGRDTVTFDVLHRISQITGTSKINFSGKSGTERISEVTSESWSEGTLSIDEVQFPKKPAPPDPELLARMLPPIDVLTPDLNEFLGSKA